MYTILELYFSYSIKPKTPPGILTTEFPQIQVYLQTKEFCLKFYQRNNNFRLGFDVILFSAEFQMEPLATCNYRQSPRKNAVSLVKFQTEFLSLKIFFDMYAMENISWTPYNHPKYQVIDKFITISRLNQ